MTRTVLSASDCLLQSIAWDHFHCESFKGENISTCGHHYHCRLRKMATTHAHFKSLKPKKKKIVQILYSFQLLDGIIGPCKMPAITSSPINVFGSLTFEQICIQWTLQGYFNALSLRWYHITRTKELQMRMENGKDMSIIIVVVVVVNNIRLTNAMHVFIITANIPSLC